MEGEKKKTKKLSDWRFTSNSSSASYSRSSTELDGVQGASSTVGVVQQVLDGDADGHDSDGVGIGLVKHGAQPLDGLGSCQRGFHGVDRLQD